MFDLNCVSTSTANAEIIIDALVKRIEELQRTEGYLQRQVDAKEADIRRLNDTNRMLCEEITSLTAKNGAECDG